MSMQSKAQGLYTQGKEMSLTKGVVIEMIAMHNQVSFAIASQLYSNCK